VAASFPPGGELFPAPAGLKCPCNYYALGFFPDGQLLFMQQFSDDSYRLGLEQSDSRLAQWLPTPVNLENANVIALSNRQVLINSPIGVITIIGLDGSVKDQFEVPKDSRIEDQSPDGSVLLVNTDNIISIYWLDGKVHGEMAIEPDASLAVSPDGQRIAVDLTTSVGIYDITGIYQGNIAFSDAVDNPPSLAWTPNSSGLAISSDGLTWLIDVPH
jgi:hypothetical protein